MPTMYAVVDKLAELLAAAPDPVLAVSRVGARRPSTSSDLPAAIVSLNIDDHKTTGVSSFMRSGETPATISSVIEVRATPQTFSTDLKRLRISELPLRKKPPSTGREFTEEDIQIRNVTIPAEPVMYRMVLEPSKPDEYAVDALEATITFGVSQASGERLEVVHWTTTYSADIRGTTYRGSVNVEVWASSLNEVESTSRKLQDRLSEEAVLMRQFGFLKLQAAGLAPMEHTLHTPAVGSAFPVWKQPLTYRFAFAAEKPSDLSSAGPIRRIDVDIEGHVDDMLSIPRPIP